VGNALAVIVGILILSALAYAATLGSAVVVTAIHITSRDDVCGANGRTYTGFTTSTGGAYKAILKITNDDVPPSCTVNSVSTTTSGFSVSGARTPLTIGWDGTGRLFFTINAPTLPQKGVLIIDLE